MSACLFVCGRMSWVKCSASPLLGHMSLVTSSLSRVLAHLTWVTCPGSLVLRYLFCVTFPGSPVLGHLMSRYFQRGQLHQHGSFLHLLLLPPVPFVCVRVCLSVCVCVCFPTLPCRRSVPACTTSQNLLMFFILSTDARGFTVQWSGDM